ncbi:MAG TPA: VWA domain-containing protein [bacterium]|nr:VWA domain-containing protein [bacterium]
MMPPIGLQHPWWLALLPLVLLVWRLGRRRLGRRWRIATALRAATLALLILALAGPTMTVPSAGVRVAFVVDRSASITPDERRAEAAFVTDALGRMHPEDQAGVVTFAGAPLLQSPVAPHAAVDGFEAAPQPDATDIGAAIDLARQILPREGARRIVVLSDGAENAGDAAAAARRAAADGIAVDAVPLAGAVPAEVLVDDVVAPAEVHVGETYQVRAVLRATVPADATVTWSRDGTPVATRHVTLAPGETAVPFADRATRETLVRYSIDVTTAADSLPGNKHGEALVVVQGEPRVLFVANDPSVLPDWLARQGLPVDVRTPDDLPTLPTALAPYGSVVLDNVAAGDLSAAQQTALQTFVGTLGGGLLAIGGPRSYGVGGYAGTPLETVLPVRMDVRQTTALPTVAVVLVIDTSGSMEAFGTELAKVALAKEIASSVIDLLSEHDQVGVITFDQTFRWLVPPTEVRSRDRILSEIARIQAGGGTLMYPPLVAAGKFLETSPAKVRHVIVMSDGLTDPGDFHTLASAMARKKITISTVAIGQDADLPFMRNLARWAGGRSYVAKDLYAIPQIFTTEALIAVRSYLVEESTPLARGGSAPTLAGLAAPPAIAGYVATVAKPAADVALQGPRRDPVLATWRYGLGRAVAFTSDDGARWTTPWTAWPQAARFWSQAVRWTLRDPGGGLYLSLAHDPRGATGQVVVDARRPDGAPWDGLIVKADLNAPGGVRRVVDVAQTAPGRYEASWPAGTPGVYAITVAARDARGPVGTRAAGLVVPYSPELREPGGNPALLAQLSEATGGMLLHAPEETFRQGHGSGTEDAWPPVAALAAAALLAEVTIRRVPAIAERLGGAAAAAGAFVRNERAASDPVRRAEDDAYDTADRWAAEEAKFAEEERLRAASMDHAARLYIAKLRAGRRP